MAGELEELIESSFDAMYRLREANKYKILFGYFQDYAKPQQQSDSEGKRFCDLKLYTKDPDSNDISVLGVPLAYIGSKNNMIDFKLNKGDELIVLFSDKSLGQWKEASGTEPQLVTDPVRDSKNHALAIPIVTTHYSSDVITVPVDDDAIGLRTKPGKKIEIGDGVNEVLDLFDQFLTEMKTLVGSSVFGSTDGTTATQNFVDGVGSSSTGQLGLVVVQLKSVEDSITAIQTALANLKV